MTTQSENIEELTKALLKVQEELEPAQKTSDNPFYKSKYADLVECVQSSRGLLTKNGLVVTQWFGHTAYDGELKNTLITKLQHISGQWIEGEMLLLPDKSGPQALQACATYGRRGGYQAAIGQVSENEDDDGEGAEDRNKKDKPSIIHEKQAIDLFKLAKTKGYDASALDSWIQDNGYGKNTYNLKTTDYNKVLIAFNKMQKDIPF